jgi:hypothetical protein
MKRNSNGYDRPRPGPLPQERENCRQPAGETGALGIFATRTLLFPLPGGEGQGEGERSTIFFEAGLEAGALNL